MKDDNYWKENLTPEQYNILREKGTEPPFSGEFHKNEEKGLYVCAGCKTPLFNSNTKYNSCTGWPSFWAPYNDININVKIDSSNGMIREEIICSNCKGHLGHMFNDGPKPTGKRYCNNGLCLVFVPNKNK